MFNYNKESYTKAKNTSIEQRKELVHLILEGKASRKDIANMGYSDYIVKKWIQEYLTPEEIELIKRRKEEAKKAQEDAKKNIPLADKIKKAEEEFNRYGYKIETKKYDQIFRFFKEELKIGDGIGLSLKQARIEINKLLQFITTDTFYKTYGRNYTIVDMYLTTNLQIKDLLITYYDLMLDEEYLPIYHFIVEQLKGIDNKCSNTYLNASRNVLSSRFEKPANKQIEDIISTRFFMFRKLNATEMDAQMAREILLDLNRTFGVKYDDVSLFIILREYIINPGNIYSFYEIGEKYKNELDLISHVEVNDITILTRRRINQKEN